MAAVIVILLVLLIICYNTNSKLKKENRPDSGIFECADEAVESPQIVQTEARDTMENISQHADVISLVEEGKSIEEIAEILNFPINKVKLIIKFDKIKKDHASS